MKKALLAAAALVALPVAAQAQAPSPGVYIGAEGGLNWLLNFTANTNNPVFPTVSVTPQTGWAVGGVIGYDFVGPRVELEGVYRNNQLNIGVPGTAINNQVGQLGIMANLLYDFMPGSVITPYIGAGAGVGFVDSNASLGSTVFAYQGIIGLGWNVDTNFRVNIDGRYYGTSNPSVNGQTWTNNNFSVMLGLQLKFGAAAPPPPPPPPPPAPPQNVAPNALDANRISGEKNIVPDDVTKTEISRSGKDKLIGSYKLCITADGNISSVVQLKSTGFPAYDSKIQSTIRGEWRYRPFTVNGKPTPVCTAVTFIYSQK
jgi:OOP family OmpA-OmpF porin